MCLDVNYLTLYLYRVYIRRNHIHSMVKHRLVDRTNLIIPVYVLRNRDAYIY